MEHHAIHLQFIQFLKSKFKKQNVLNQYSIFYNTPTSIISGLSVLIKLAEFTEFANLYHIIEDIESKIFLRFFEIIKPLCLNKLTPPGVSPYISVAHSIFDTLQTMNSSLKTKENIVVKFNTIEEHKDKFIINYHVF